jgi:glyoxylase-like metal-dependent hydrolase (beta-lactamase superfamily II)
MKKTRPFREILPGVWTWSVFSEEKNFFFNGHVLRAERGVVVVDPPEIGGADAAALETLRPINRIIVTNRDHVRAAEKLRDLFNTTIAMHPADIVLVAPLQIDHTLSVGETVARDWKVMLLAGKTAGEIALFTEKDGGILLVGDALIGDPPGELSLLPDEKLQNPAKLRQNLRENLKNLQFDKLLVGDGESILSGAGAKVREFLAKL